MDTDSFRKFFGSTMGIIVAILAFFLVLCLLCLMCSAFGHLVKPDSPTGFQFTPHIFEHSDQRLLVAVLALEAERLPAHI